MQNLSSSSYVTQECSSSLLILEAVLLCGCPSNVPRVQAYFKSAQLLAEQFHPLLGILHVLGKVG